MEGTYFRRTDDETASERLNNVSSVRAGKSQGDRLVPKPVSEPVESVACDVVVVGCLCDLGETV